MIIILICLLVAAAVVIPWYMFWPKKELPKSIGAGTESNNRYNDLSPVMKRAVRFVLDLMQNGRQWEKIPELPGAAVLFEGYKHKIHDVEISSYYYTGCTFRSVRLQGEDIPVAAKDVSTFLELMKKLEAGERAHQKDRRVEKILDKMEGNYN